jgi:hypothetical protein
MTDLGHEIEIDPRLIFLLRAAVRFDLVEVGELTLEEAYDGLFDAAAGVAA